MNIIELTVLVSPYRRYLKVREEDAKPFDGLRLVFKVVPKNWSKTTHVIFELNSSTSKILRTIKDHKLTEEACPRLHEARWQETNDIKECE